MKYLICISCLFLFASCEQRDVVFAKEYTIEKDWPHDQSFQFDFEIQDTIASHDLLLIISHDKEFPNQNFYTKFLTTYPDDRQVADVVSMELANKFGQWNGKCKGESCAVEILLQGAARFKIPGNHSIQIEQFNRIEQLEGIQKIEFQIVRL